ncbi:MAG TPA: LuxR C-terminal-related transcriptional regulator [Dermatophilaceae bacterium]|nr:LuxR C-terminal-related transcriptional regulator [Dermatophilaceae bacterium]
MLDAAVREAALTLVTSGPGGGKSVLLAEWARSRSVPTPWLALTPADNDPHRFWSQFLRAVRVAGTEPLPGTWTGEAVPGLLDQLFADAAPAVSPAVVVLDDAHLVNDEQVLAGLDRIVQRWSSEVRLVLAARSVPLLPLHRYRLADRLAELRSSDLAMRPGEAFALLRAHGVTLPDGDVAELTGRMEGWTGGLRLAAMRMQDSPRPGEVAQELALDRGSIGEYLVEEVLASLPPRTRHLLLTTSVLDEVTVEAAVAVSGVADAADVLAGLARTNAFVVPVDPTLTAFRYHHLFREVLRHLGTLRSPDERTETDRRVSAWFCTQRDVGNALRWAVRTGDLALARAVLVRGGLATAFVTSQRLADVPLDALERAPDVTGEEAAVTALALASLRAQRSSGRGAVPRPPLPDVEPGDPELAVTAGVARVLVALASGATADLAHPVERLLEEDLRRAVAAVPGLRGKLLLTLGRARFFSGRLAEVEPLLVEALEAAAQDGAPGVELEVLGVAALASASAGRPARVNAALERASDVLRRHPRLRPPTALDVARARQAYLRGDLPTMGAALERALAAGPIYDAVVGGASIAYLQGAYLATTGRLEQALTWLHAPALTAPGLGLLGLYRDAEIAAVEVALGRPHRALAVLRPHERGPFATSAAVPIAFTLLALGEVDAAERAVRPVLTSPGPQLDRFAVVSAMVCGALVDLTRGDDAAALAGLARAMDLAGGDILVPLVRMTPAFAPLLARHPEMAARWPAAVPAAPDGHAPARHPAYGLGEPLTERELAVLRLLPTDMAKAEIAGALFVSVNTVKTHVSGVYRKLGVGRRRDAVTRARELELL